MKLEKIIKKVLSEELNTDRIQQQVSSQIKQKQDRIDSFGKLKEKTLKIQKIEKTLNDITRLKNKLNFHISNLHNDVVDELNNKVNNGEIQKIEAINYYAVFSYLSDDDNMGEFNVEEFRNHLDISKKLF